MVTLMVITWFVTPALVASVICLESFFRGDIGGL